MKARFLALRRAASFLSFAAFCACAVIAVVSPAREAPRIQRDAAGCDIILALDISRSMDVRDGGIAEDTRQPLSRLERAVRSAVIFCDVLDVGVNPSFRFGIVLGKSRAVSALPLTSDMEAAVTLLESLTSASLSARSTNLENLIDTAEGAFPAAEGAAASHQRVIVLFTDGDEVQGNMAAAIERASRRGITVATLGTGSREGGVVPGEGDSDSDMRSSLRAAVLREAVEKNGAFYFDNDRDAAAEHLAALIRQRTVDPKTESRAAGMDRRALFIAAAFLSLWVSRLARYRFGKHS